MEEAVVCVLESDEADMTFIMEFLVHIYAYTYLSVRIRLLELYCVYENKLLDHYNEESFHTWVR